MMPEKIKSVTVCLEGQKQVYRPGDEVRGYWTLTSEKEFTTKGVLSTFQGVAFVKWTEYNWNKRFEDDEYISYEVYCKNTVQLHGRGDTNENIQPGVYKYPFKYRIPLRLPSSFEGSKGAIRYIIQIRIRRPIPFPDVTRYKCITVLEDIDINEACYKNPQCYKKDCQVPKALGFGNAGKVELWGKIDRSAYCPGEQIALSIVVKNDSTQNLGKIKAQLMQYVTFIGNAKEEYANSTIKVITSNSELVAGKVINWDNQLILIDGIPATIERPTCQCISVRYVLEVIVSVPLFTGSDMKLIFPVTIGTVPFGKSLKATSQSQAAGIQVTDVSKAITYTSCNKGWRPFNQSSTSRNFPNMTYTPMCAYAVNYKYKNVTTAPKPKQNVTPSAKSNAATNTPSNVASATRLSTNPTTRVTKTSTPPPTKTVSTSNTSIRVTNSTTPTALQPSAPQLEALSKQTGATGTGQHQPATNNLPNSGSVSAAANSQVEGSISPPSYEEAMGLPDSSVNDNSDDEEEDAGVYYMIIRFSKDIMEDFLFFVKNNKKLLEIQNGRLIFKSIKPYKSIGNWPKGKHVVLLSFPSKKEASDWITTSPGIQETKWLKNSDIVVTGVKEQFQSGKTMVTISEISMIEENVEAVTRYRNLIENILRPLRIAHGGILSVNTPKYAVLQGTWRTGAKSKLSIMAWPDITAVKNYKSSIAELQAVIDELKPKCMIIHNSATFDIANISMEDSQGEDSTSTS
ncbi:uncharacterized protein [Mytilus edulis]|uniref:uncharacterized protein n=1 Tax=Mytilus edulis TaxID=6550 RepID=UPI0039EF2F6E